MTFSIDNPRGVATTPLRKICLGKTLRRTRVKVEWQILCDTENAGKSCQWSSKWKDGTLQKTVFFCNSKTKNQRKSFFLKIYPELPFIIKKCQTC